MVDPIAGLALLATILLGLLNYLYTRQMSMAVSHPVLDISADVVEQREIRGMVYWPTSHVRYVLKNSNSSVAILDVCVSTYISRPNRGLLLWRRRWVSYGSPIPAFSIDPLGTTTVTTRTTCEEGLETFLIQSFDSVLETTEEQTLGSRRPRGFYKSLHKHPLRLRVCAEYRPGLQRARKRTVRTTYRLTSHKGIVDRGSGLEALNGWNLELMR